MLCLQVIQACHSCPKAIEVVVNAYEHIRWNVKWKRAIPDDDLEVKNLFPSSGFQCKYFQTAMEVQKILIKKLVLRVL